MLKKSAAEILIAELMAICGMSREAAIVALVIKDQRCRNAGQAPLVEGEPLSVIYANEMAGELVQAEAVRVVAYVKDMSLEEAQADLIAKVESGVVFFETKH